MAENSKIEWTHHTFNPWRGCTKVSDGCKNCYADAMSKRNPQVLGAWGPNGSRPIAADSYWRQPIEWNRTAKALGERHRVFCSSLADVFEGDDTMPESARLKVYIARQRLAAIIRDTPNLDWLLLTKRPENVSQIAAQIYPSARIDLLSLPNVWIGTSVENQQAADHRIPELLKIPAAVRFLSIEPLLGPVDLDSIMEGLACPIHWVIVGGESGTKARPLHRDWVRSIKNQCIAAGVPFFFKQWGEYQPVDQGDDPVDHRTPEHVFEDKSISFKLGKKAAGRELDGRTWDEFPTVSERPAQTAA